MQEIRMVYHLNQPAPMRMPLPLAKSQGSVYENQIAGKRYFGFVEKA
jgi:hypothetical protein